MIKTAEQIKAVLLSPEFKQCAIEEQLGKPLSQVCELIRHQAASIDAIKTELQMPFDMTKSPILSKVADILRTYFLTQLRTDVSTSPQPMSTLSIWKVSYRVVFKFQLTCLHQNTRVVKFFLQKRLLND